MPTYQQKWIDYEEGYGDTTTIIRISDTDSGLLEPESEVLDVDFLSVDSVDEQLEDKDAALVEDSFSFTSDEAMIRDGNADEIACQQLLRTAIDPTVRVFVAIFLDAPDPITGFTIDQAVFVGDISPDQSEEDLYWTNGQWGSSPAPVKTVSYENRPLAETLLDDIKVKDMIDGIPEELPEDPGIEGITNTWMDANVENKIGWLYETVGSAPYGRYIKYHMLCPLNTVLRKLADMFAEHIERKIGNPISVVFDRIVLDGEYIPARVKPATDIYTVKVDNVPNPSNPTGIDTKWYTVQPTDKRKLAIDPDAVSPDEEEQLYIDFKQISYGKYDDEAELPTGWHEKFWEIVGWEYDENEAVGFMWHNQAETFADLLYGLAYDLGLKLRISFDDTSTVRISFIPFSSFVKSRAYLKDAEKATLDIEYIEEEEYGREGWSHPYTKDGREYTKIYRSAGNGSPYILKNTFDSENQKRSLLTISPTMVMTDTSTANDYYGGLYYFHMINSLKEFYSSTTGRTESPAYRDLNEDGTKASNYQRQAILQTSAIFMNVKQLEADKFHDEEPLDFYAPACKMVIKIDGVDTEFEKLSDYTGLTRARTSNFAKLTKKVSVPFLHGFSLSSDGSSPHWSNIRVGSEVVLDSITYTVTKVTRNLSEHKTDLELVTVKLASEIADATAATSGQSVGKGGITKNTKVAGTTAIIGNSTNAIYKDEYELGEDIDKGKHVWYKSDEKIYESKGAAEEYGRGLGILLRDGVNGDLREVLELGDFRFDSAVLTPGSIVYLRKDTGGGLNISHTPLTDKNGTEVLYKELGIAQSDQVLSYNPRKEAIHL